VASRFERASKLQTKCTAIHNSQSGLISFAVNLSNAVFDILHTVIGLSQ